MTHTTRRLAAALSLTVIAATAQAAATPEEAAKLKGELTPLGAERSGNKEGTIPAWTGGYATPIPGATSSRRDDPFKDDKVQLTITGKNADQYADKLTEGTKALLKKYPDYRVDVYPTRRTGGAPQYVYDNTFKNATRGKIVDDYPEGVVGGIPFPIPKTGEEVIWNHSLRWVGNAFSMSLKAHQITTEGKVIMVSEGTADNFSPYYIPDLTLADYESKKELGLVRFVNSGPPIRAGEAIVGRRVTSTRGDSVWVYLTGQRRVRKLPNACCDTPTAATAGLMSFDEINVFSGQTDRYDWKLAGKKEMYIPYNNNRSLLSKNPMELVGSHFVSPDVTRWELHRVWIVDATIREGKRHQSPKSRYYCDEDTWTCVLADRWDSNGQLWKSVYGMVFTAPEINSVQIHLFGYNDFVAGTAYINGPVTNYQFPKSLPDNYFTPDGLTGSTLR